MKPGKKNICIPILVAALAVFVTTAIPVSAKVSLTTVNPVSAKKKTVKTWWNPSAVYYKDIKAEQIAKTGTFQIVSNHTYKKGVTVNPSTLKPEVDPGVNRSYIRFKAPAKGTYRFTFSNLSIKGKKPSASKLEAEIEVRKITKNSIGGFSNEYVTGGTLESGEKTSDFKICSVQVWKENYESTYQTESRVLELNKASHSNIPVSKVAYSLKMKKGQVIYFGSVAESTNSAYIGNVTKLNQWYPKYTYKLKIKKKN